MAARLTQRAGDSLVCVAKGSVGVVVGDGGGSNLLAGFVQPLSPTPPKD
jgi:hypothetical protein